MYRETYPSGAWNFLRFGFIDIPGGLIPNFSGVGGTQRCTMSVIWRLSCKAPSAWTTSPLVAYSRLWAPDRAAATDQQRPTNIEHPYLNQLEPGLQGRALWRYGPSAPTAVLGITQRSGTPASDPRSGEARELRVCEVSLCCSDAL